MPKFNFEEDQTHCSKRGSLDYVIEDHVAICTECGTQIIIEENQPQQRKGKKARFRE